MNTLRFPDPSTTSRPDVPIADAYLIDGMECGVVDGDYFTMPFASDVERDESVTPLEILSSFDHALRTADESAHAIGIEAAALVALPTLDYVCRALFGHGIPVGLIDWNGAVAETVGFELDEYRDSTSGLMWADDPDQAETLYEWSQGMEDNASSVGYVVDSSADSGMTWFYRPIGDPITLDVD